MTKSLKMLCLGGALALLLAPATGSAAPITFFGQDNNVGPGGPHPNSTAAANAFAAAAGSPSTTITFEGLPLTPGPFTNLPVGSGVTATLTNTDPAFSGISNNNSQTLGFNVTPGGNQFLQVSPNFGGPTASLTFTRATPFSSFGLWLTGTETAFPGTLTLTFNDGTNEVLPIPKNTTAGVEFFGFTDAGASITSVTLNETGDFTNSRDIFGVDDVTFAGTGAAVPEPSTLALAGLAGLGLAGWRRWRKRAA